MTTAMTMKQHDLLPALEVNLVDGTDPVTGADVPVDLSTAVSIKVICWRANVLLFSRPISPLPTGPDAETGLVTMTWQSSDTAQWGDLYLEVEVTWGASKPQTFPRDGYLIVHIEPDLG